MVIHIFLHILSKNCICGYHLKVHSSRKSSEASVQEQHHDDGVMSNDVTSEMVIEYETVTETYPPFISSEIRDLRIFRSTSCRVHFTNSDDLRTFTCFLPQIHSDSLLGGWAELSGPV